MSGVEPSTHVADCCHGRYLVLTFVGETRLLAITEDDELEEAEPDGFDAVSQVCTRLTD